MPSLLLTFYGDDFTGSTDALEQLTLAGIRAVLFIEPPTREQLAQFKNLQAIGVAGVTRSLPPAAMEKELRPVFKKLKALGARHVHYKVCSTFDSSPAIGSIGHVMDIGSKMFPARFIPVLAAAPALGRYTIFGNHFARFGIGSAGEIHRLDRHPSINQHPITPMTEADLRAHLARQTKKKIALFDILKVSLPLKKARIELGKVLAKKPDAILFDALSSEQLQLIGELIDGYASARRPLFSVGSSGIETALAALFNARSSRGNEALNAKAGINLRLLTSSPTKQLLVASGSCSPVTEGQIACALKNGFGEVALDTATLATEKNIEVVIKQATEVALKFLQAGRSVIVHTSRGGNDPRLAATAKVFKQRGLKAAETKLVGAILFGAALGKVASLALEQSKVRRLCIAGGDTSSYAARELRIDALEMIAPLTPGAPLCRAHALNSPANNVEIVFKGGQVGPENYFEIVKRGKK